MAIRRHEIYGKSRRSLSNYQVTATQVLKETVRLKATHKHLNSFTKLDFYWWRTPTCQAEPPTCHRTAELLRGEHHIRRSESSSLPAVIHTVNLIINQPLSPPTSLPV